MLGGESRTLVVAAAHDEFTLESVFSASKKLPIKYILVGNREKIFDISAKLDVDLENGCVVDAVDDTDSARKAVALIREGRGDALMKGILETGTLLKAVLDRETGIRGTGSISHFAMLEVPSYHKLVAITDAGIMPYPTFEQKADIIRNSVDFYKRLGFTGPKIAALCAIEHPSDKMPETLEAEQLKVLADKGEFGDCLLEGPISLDLAVSKKSAGIKGYVSEVTGDVDILMVPNITAGNVLCKVLLYWGGAKMAGCALGAKVPIVIVSRGATAEEKFLSIMMCLKAE
jgi:phosphate butyryltransferase